MRLYVAPHFIFGNGEREILSEAYDFYLGHVGCFPLVDGKISLDGLKDYLDKTGEKPYNDFENKTDPDLCAFSVVESIVADGMSLETAGENLSTVYNKYQTGEYNHISIDLVSQMTYSEYCRMLEGTLEGEDFHKFGTLIMTEYPRLPPLFFLELSLSDGTKFEFCTRVELSETLKKRLAEDIVMFEAECTDENGKLDAEACIQKIKAGEYYYAFDALWGK